MPRRLQLRVAAAETMSRPNLNQLAPNAHQQCRKRRSVELFYSGTVGLRPIKAYQADLSLEWYYAPHSAVTVALFGKRLRDDIYDAVQTNVDLGTIQYVGGPPGSPQAVASPFLWTITAPANGAKSEFTGFELTWQHMLQNGFGVYMQYTHTTSKGYDQFGASTGPINAAPPTTASISLIYDKGPLSADVTWDHTSSYTFACSRVHRRPGVARDLRFLRLGDRQRAL